MGRLIVAEARNFLLRGEFPFFIQLIGEGDVPGTVEISVWTGEGERARRYFSHHPVVFDGVEVPIIVSEGPSESNPPDRMHGSRQIRARSRAHYAADPRA